MPRHFSMTCQWIGVGCSLALLWAAPVAAQVASTPATERLKKLTASELAEGWISLFDGQSFYGWKPVTDVDWTVRDGAIHATTGTKGLLRTTTQFSDFLLKLDFLATPSTNSGVFVRTPPVPRDPGSDCYEINIAPADNPFPTASLVKRKVSTAMPYRGGWRHLEIEALGGHLRVQVDDAPALEYVDPRPLGRGYLGLQFNQGAIGFCNVRLKPLGLVDLLAGPGLEGWTRYEEMASEFRRLDDGRLHVRGGRGQLESRRTFGDFVLQLECQTHAEGLNSGIFFRCIPGDVMMGYESQIHNGILDGDPTKPADCGTGGIFRRQDARRVVAHDQAWFHETLIAEGPHVAVWVEGYQVTDWTDRRAPHDNPRKGLRTQAGTLMIQGHDPTTDISFRNLRAVEIAPRRP